MSTALDIVRSSIARCAHSVVMVAIGLFMTPYLVRNLGEHSYGIWVLVSSLSTNYYLLDLGLSAATARFVALRLAEGDQDGANVVVNTAVGLYSLLALCVFAIVVIASLTVGFWLHEAAEVRTVRLLVVIVGVNIGLEFPLKALAGVVTAVVRHDLIVVNHLGVAVISTGLTLLLVGYGYGVVALALAGLVAGQVSNLLYFLTAKRLLPGLHFTRGALRRSVARGLWGYSIWAFTVQMANQIRFRLDAAVVAAKLSASSVTHYSIGQGITERFTGLLATSTGFITPVFTKYWAQERYEDLRERFLLLTRVNLVLGAFGGGLLIVLGKPFIVRWMGSAFESSYAVMVVLMLAMVTEVVGNTADNLLFAVAKHRYLAMVNAVEAVANLVISISLAPRFGMIGVAVGTAVPLLFFRLTVIPVLAARAARISLARYYWNMVPVTAFTVVYMAAFGAIVPPRVGTGTYTGIAICALLAVPLYLLAVPTIGFSRSERQYALQFAKRTLGIRCD